MTDDDTNAKQKNSFLDSIRSIIRGTPRAVVSAIPSNSLISIEVPDGRTLNIFIDSGEAKVLSYPLLTESEEENLMGATNEDIKLSGSIAGRSIARDMGIPIEALTMEMIKEQCAADIESAEELFNRMSLKPQATRSAETILDEAISNGKKFLNESRAPK